MDELKCCILIVRDKEETTSRPLNVDKSSVGRPRREKERPMLRRINLTYVIPQPYKSLMLTIIL